jgi:hypothetical protein
MKVSAARQWEVEYLFLVNWPRIFEKKKICKLVAILQGIRRVLIQLTIVPTCASAGLRLARSLRGRWAILSWQLENRPLEAVVCQTCPDIIKYI